MKYANTKVIYVQNSLIIRAEKALIFLLFGVRTMSPSLFTVYQEFFLALRTRSLEV